MANPQLEDGHTRLAHEILDEICQYAFNGAQLRIIIKIWRLTYGWGRKEHEFSITFLHQSTKLSESTVKKEVAFLIKTKVLIVIKNATKATPRILRFNKDYEMWNIPKSGDPVERKIDLFNYAEVQDLIPDSDEVKVQDHIPVKVQDTVLLHENEGYDTTPSNKDLSTLKKKIFKETVDLFEKFYSIYPRRIAKEAAKKTWIKLAKKDEIDADLIINNTMNYAETCKLLKTEVNFIPHPSTYLNQKRYTDYTKVDPEGMATKNKKQTKLSKNKELLLGGRGKNIHDGRGSEIHPVQSLGSLPEPD